MKKTMRLSDRTHRMFASRNNRPSTRLLALAAAIIALTPSPLTSASAPPVFDPPENYYLALGDSVTYGFQFSKFLAGQPPSAFNTGFVDDFGARLRQIRPGMRTVNYGCPGETTVSFINGPCPWTAGGRQLHDNFSGSQLDAAVAFLRAHPGEVSPITLTLWGNDVSQLVVSCGGDLTCVQHRAPGAIAQVSMNLSAILDRLRAEAPNAEIIVTGAWDSFIGAFSVGDPLFEALNVPMANVAGMGRSRFADPFPIFNPQGDAAAEGQAMCTLTLLCTDGDSHPSDDGYRALAAVVFEASDYVRLLE